eukprot:TRINITY_DN45408_c0_g1_i1.p1 TRINITY_DN45408_c0_g1~~TRINITY_DN45408_c0_g1_i1.p1  ORF type:complete len:907 (+),score=145.48 TRINITY_DN45408_c0_g1_i1:145-2865(+)
MPAAQSAPPPSWRLLADLASELPPETSAPSDAVCLEALPDSIALLRLGSGMPECVRSAARSGQFCVVVQEPAAASAWVPRRLLPRADELTKRDGAVEQVPGMDWCALRIGRCGAGRDGIKTFADQGVAAAVCSQIATVVGDARLLSPFGMEVILVPEVHLPRAVEALVRCGHAVWPCSRVCDHRAWRELGSFESPTNGVAPRADPCGPDADADSDLSRRLAGVWNMAHREEPLGTIVQEFADGEGRGAVRLQVPSGLFIQVRAPDGESEQMSFGGRCCISENSDDQIICTQLRSMDFQPSVVDVPTHELTLEATSFEAVGQQGGEHRELWARIGKPNEQDFVALELQSETPAPKTPRAGLWLFSGRRFARLLTPSRGGGMVANTCCKSIAQLQKTRGTADVTLDLRENYEVVYGTVEELGFLRTRIAWPTTTSKSGAVYFRTGDSATGNVEVTADCVTRTLPSGRKEVWRVVEWTFNPFVRPDHLPPLEEIDLEPASPASASSSMRSDHEGADEDAPAGFAGCIRSPSPVSGVGGLAKADAEERRDNFSKVVNAANDDNADEEASAAGTEAGEEEGQSEDEPDDEEVVKSAAVEKPNKHKKRRKEDEAGDDPSKKSKKSKEKTDKKRKDHAEKSRKKGDKNHSKANVERSASPCEKERKAERRPLPSVSPGKPLPKAKKEKNKKHKKSKDRKASPPPSEPEDEQDEAAASPSPVPVKTSHEKKKKKEKHEKKAKKTKAADPDSDADENGADRGRGRSPASPPKLAPAVRHKKAAARKASGSDSSQSPPAATPPPQLRPIRPALNLAAKALQEVRAKAKGKKNKASLKTAAAVAAASPSPPRKVRRCASRSRSREQSPPTSKGKQNGRGRSRSASAKRSGGGSRNAFKTKARSRSQSGGGKARRKAR